jgi:hypothetical protein
MDLPGCFRGQYALGFRYRQWLVTAAKGFLPMSSLCNRSVADHPIIGVIGRWVGETLKSCKEIETFSRWCQAAFE